MKTILKLPFLTTVLLLCLPFFLGIGSASAQDSTATDKPKLRLEVHKKARELHVFQGDEKTATYPIGLGFAPDGHKVEEGDGKTPEGRYVVCVKNPQSRYYLSLGLNYPNAEDAERALADGRISKAEAEAARQAEARGVCPSWKTRLGGEIYIHGRGSSSDWTLGCVALDDGPMKKLFESTPVGTEVRILP